MVGAIGWVHVLEVIVEGEEVYIMHDHVVTDVSTHEKSRVEEAGPIEPA